MTPALYLTFTIDGCGFGFAGFGISKTHGTVPIGVRGTAALVVRLNTALRIFRGTDVETAIGASKDVDVMQRFSAARN